MPSFHQSMIYMCIDPTLSFFVMCRIMQMPYCTRQMRQQGQKHQQGCLLPQVLPKCLRCSQAWLSSQMQQLPCMPASQLLQDIISCQLLLLNSQKPATGDTANLAVCRACCQTAVPLRTGFAAATQAPAIPVNQFIRHSLVCDLGTSTYSDVWS